MEQLDPRRVLATTTVILDNQNACPQHCRLGTWATAPGVGYANSIAYPAAPFVGNEEATWSFNGIDPGQYRVSATWHYGAPSYGSNVPITIYNGGPSIPGTQQIGSGVLNQQLSPDDFQDFGVYWENISVVVTGTNQLVVKMTDLANGYAIADAIRIEKIVPVSDSVIIDADKPGFSKSGTWGSAAVIAGAYGGNVSWNVQPNDGSEVAEWTFNVVPGTYRLSTSLHAGQSIHASNNVVSVFNGSQLLANLSLDQTVSYSDYYLDGAWWKHLAVFSATSTLKVRMSDVGNGYLIADAFRIQREAEFTPVPLSGSVSIAIVNPSFENQLLADGTFGPYQNGVPVPITGWGYGQLLNPNAISFPSGLTTDGQNVATGPYRSNYLSQVLTHVPLPNKEYRLRVDVGDRLDALLDGWRIELRSNSQILASMDSAFLTVPEGGFATAQLTYTTSDQPPTGPWEIVLIETNTVTNGVVTFDNVRLNMQESRFSVPVAVDDLQYYTPTFTDLIVGTANSLTQNDTSFDGAGKWASIVVYPAHGILSSFNADGTFVYKPDPAFIGVDTFVYRTHNGVLQSNTARAQITVGARLLPRQNSDANVFNMIPGSNGLGQGYSNIPQGSSMDTDSSLAKTGGLVLAEDVLPGVSLVYRADDLMRPIIEVESQFPVGQPVPTLLAAQLTFQGVTSAVTFNTAGFEAGQRFRIAFQVDGRSLPTGRYSYQVNLGANVANGNATYYGNRVIVNRTQSPFGSGWSMDGLDRIHEQADGLLLVRGNGDYLWFPNQGTSYGLAEGDTSFTIATKNANGSFTLTSKDGAVSLFSNSGLLVSYRDRSSNVTSFAYADQNADGAVNELVSITEPYGRLITLGYSAGKVSTLQHYSGRLTQLTISNSQLTSYALTDPDATGPLTSPVTSFTYIDSQLTSRTNAISETTIFSYAPSHGRLEKVTFANNDEWKLQAEETVALTSSQLKKSADIHGTVTDGLNKSWKFQSDRFGNITRSETPGGNVRTFSYNSNGQVYRSQEPDKDTGQPTGAVTMAGYNEFGDLAVLVAPDNGTTKIKYTERYHQPVLIVDPVGRTNRSLYDSAGNEVQSIDGAGSITSRYFNARGLVTVTTSPDPDGAGPQVSQVTSYGYDGFGRMVNVLFPDGATNVFGYTPADEVYAAVDELGKTSIWSFDLLGRTISTRNRVNSLVQTKYDALSRPIQQIDPLSNVTDLTYDQRGRLKAIAYPDPDGQYAIPRPIDTLTYDKNSNLIGRKNPDSTFVGDIAYQYDSDDRLSARSHAAYTSSQPLETYEYDRRGQMQKVNRVGRDVDNGTLIPVVGNSYVKYTYDSVGRIKQEERFGLMSGDSYVLNYDYNAAGELTSRTDGKGNVQLNVYDSRGLLVQETGPDPDVAVGTSIDGPLFSQINRYSFDALGRLTSVDRGFGRVTSYEYNNRNWLTKVTEPDPDGSGPLLAPITQMTYNLRGDQLSEISALGRLTTFGYDDEQRLLSRFDPDPDGSGPLTAPLNLFYYDSANRLVAETNPRGASSYYGYDALGRLTAIVAPDPDDAGPLTTPVTGFYYNNKGLAAIVDPLGRSTSFELDNAGRRIAVTDTAGAITNYVYNFYDQVVTVIEPDPDGAGPLTRSTTRNRYNSDGRLFETEDALSNKTAFTYDLAGNALSVTSGAVGAEQTTLFTYDNLNRKIAETKKVSTYGATATTGNFTRSFQYDVAGNLTRTIDRNGRVNQYIYDKLDRVIGEKWLPNFFSEAGVTTLANGARQDETQKVGWTANSATNLSGTFLLTYSTSTTAPLAWNASEATIRSALEAFPQIGVGNVDVTVTNVGTFGREIRVTFKNALGGQNVNQISISTAALIANIGGVTRIAQTDVQGSATAEQQRLRLPSFGDTGSLGGVWYVAFGSEVSGPLPGNALSADVANALNAFAGIDNVTVTGSLGWFEVKFGGTQSSTNMPEIRMDTNNLYSNSSVSRTITSTYNAEDELVSVSDPSATINYTRDRLGRATTIQNQIGNVATNTVYDTYTFTQTFDAASNRTKLQAAYNGSADFINDYYYDKLNRLTVIDQSGTFQAKRVTMAYNALGQRTQLDRYESYGTTPTIATTSYTYDTANRLSRIEHKKGATVFNAHDYVYDQMSRITKITSKIGPVDVNGQPRSVDFSYDALSQLLSADDGTQVGRPGSQAFSYAYDANGNRTGSGYTAPTDNRVQTGPDGESYEYDLEGNLIRIYVNGIVSKTLTWDNRNRLTEVYISAGTSSTSVKYEYDASNRLIKRSQSGFATTWGYDEGINPLIQSDNPVGRTHRYLWSDRVDELLADEQNPTGSGWNTLWTLADHQGTAKDLLDVSGSTSSIVNSRLYDAFGNLKSQTGTTNMPIGYTGKYFDQVTGLQNSWNRWYSPKMGRFVSQDPIGFAAGDVNMYRYVRNQVTVATDPSGLIGQFAPTISPFDDDRGESGENDGSGGYIGTGDLLDTLANFSAGIGDGMSLGMSWLVRDKLFGINTTQYDSSGYYWGGWGGFAVDVLSGGTTAVVKSGGKAVVKTAVKEGGEAVVKNSDTIVKAAAKAPKAGLARVVSSLDEFKASRNLDPEELQKAWEVYQRAARSKGLTIGKTSEILEYAGQNGRDVLYFVRDPKAPLSGWTWEINKAWLDGAIDSRLSIQILTKWDELPKSGALWREFNYLISKGYRLKDGLLVPPPLP